ncbi:hypothetical protein Tco_0116289 [Tanacetum coccineum]
MSAMTCQVGALLPRSVGCPMIACHMAASDMSAVQVRGLELHGLVRCSGFSTRSEASRRLTWHDSIGSEILISLAKYLVSEITDLPPRLVGL